MNENPQHDKALDDAIERLVHGNKSSGNELLDTLGAAKPKANPAFMANLEDRLMAEFSSKEKETKMLKRKERPSKFGRWPLTMAAAILAIVLVGGFAFFMQAKSGEEASGIVMNPVTAVVALQAMIPGTVIEADMVELDTFTPNAALDQVLLIANPDLVIGRTATNYVSVGEPLLISDVTIEMNPAMIPVVIAIQDIPAGTEITPDLVELILMPAENAPSDALNELRDAVGQYAKTDIYREEFILARKIDNIQPLVLTLTAIAVRNCPEPTVSYIQYQIQSGDTMFSIARDNNVSALAISELNCFDIVSPDYHVGDFVRIPLAEADPFSLTATAILAFATEQAQPSATQRGAEPNFQATATALVAFATDQAERNCQPSDIDTFLYQIQVGDTIFSIARNMNTTVDEIAALNCLNLGSPNFGVGDLLRIPVSNASASAGVVEPTARPLNPINSVPVIPHAPEAQGCDALTRFYQPMNGQVINAPITVEAMVEHADFAQAKIEILGPSTNGQWVTIATIPQATTGADAIGQFVPSLYEAGEYLFSLQTFSSLGNLVGTCRVTVYISAAPSQNTSNLSSLVMALHDIPLGTIITADMLSVVYWPNEAFLNYSQSHAEQVIVNQLDELIGQESRTFIPALSPIDSDWYGAPLEDDAVAVLAPDRVAIAMEDTNGDNQQFVLGQSVDVIVAYQLMNTDANGQTLPSSTAQTVLSRTVVDAEIIWMGPFPDSGYNGVNSNLTDSQNLIMLAVSQEDAEVLTWIAEAGIPYLFVPHLEGSTARAMEVSAMATVVPVAVGSATEEITAYYPIAEDFVGDYAAIASDSRALFMAVMPANSSSAALAGIPFYTTRDGRQVLAFEVTAQVGSYTRTLEDGTVESGSSARLLLSTTQAAWLEQLNAGGVRYQYTLMPLNRLDSANLAPEYPSAEDGNPPNTAMMQGWFDASALSFSIGQKVDVVGQFIYRNADGQFEGMISQRIGLSMTVVSMEAGTGEMSAYALVGLDVNEEDLAIGQMIGGFQTYLNPANSQVLETWSLVPYNPDLGASINYFAYNGNAEPIPVEAASVASSKYFVAVPSLELENLSGGFSVGDSIKIHLNDESFVIGQISYIGSAIYAPFTMQAALDELRAENPRVVIFEVTNAEDADAVNNTLDVTQSITIERP